jgi:small subunit ribosomal protein S20
MANRKAKIKTISVNATRRLRNRSLRTALHTQMRRVDDAISSGDADKIASEVKNTVVCIDRSASKGIIHKNKAARTKSRLMARVAKVQG